MFVVCDLLFVWFFEFLLLLSDCRVVLGSLWVVVFEVLWCFCSCGVMCYFSGGWGFWDLCVCLFGLVCIVLFCVGLVFCVWGFVLFFCGCLF